MPTKNPKSVKENCSYSHQQTFDFVAEFIFVVNPTRRISMAGGRAGTPGARYDRTTREHESQEDREARLGRQRIRTNHLIPRQH